MTLPARNRIAAGLMTVAVGLAFASCARHQERSVQGPRAVPTAEVQQCPFSVDASYSARIEAKREVDIVPKVGGKVQSVGADIGSAVREGQVLFTLEPGDYDAQYRQARAALQSANASLTRTSDAGQEQQIIQAQAAVDQAQVGYEDAKSLYDKTQRLYEGGAVSKQQLDDVEARYKNAQIQLDAATQSLKLVRDKSGPQNSDVVAAQVEQAKAQAELAKSQLDSTVIRSPISGHVSYRNVEVGEMVGSSTLAFVIIDDSSLLAEAGLSERVVTHVRPGMELSVSIDALGGAEVKGRIDSVSPSADPRTRLYALRVRIDGTGGSIRPGMVAKISIPLETKPNALLIPESATFSANGSDAVYAVDSGRARLRRITLGESDGTRVEVLSGLRAGDTIVTSGQEFLNDGEEVAPR
ncbi:MAG TPA: efflux RND transporter periplasmic adaptor subunit [Rectinemataceae bacterium]|nr:efflux RND transporter periplasmic adaptor subunit [Rectinemataceae bacterium]